MCAQSDDEKSAAIHGVLSGFPTDTEGSPIFSVHAAARVLSHRSVVLEPTPPHGLFEN